MTLSDFTLHVFVLVDDLLKKLALGRLRSRGKQTTTLTDSEVITIGLVGEFLGLDHDKGLFEHVRRYHAADFPGLTRVHRTTFARQSASLFAVGKRIHAHLAQQLAARESLWLIDSMPVEVSRFARAKFCRRLRGDAAYGYDHTRRNTCYGFRLHARVTPAGAVVAFDLAPANVSDQAMVDQLDRRPGRSVSGTGTTGPRKSRPTWPTGASG